jgi:hypothetical protein
MTFRVGARHTGVGDRRQFLTAAAAFAAGAAISEGTADASLRAVTILSGYGPPAKHLGLVGDFYIDNRAHTIYGPKRRAGWGRATRLIGPHGDLGPPGGQGPRGYSVLHGTGPPQPNQGGDNDFYIDTSTTQLYGPKESGIWGSPISLTGAANIAVIDGGAP